MTIRGNELRGKLQILISEIDDAVINQKLSYQDCALLMKDVQNLEGIIGDDKIAFSVRAEKEESSAQEDDAKAEQANQLANKLKDAECAIKHYKDTINLLNKQLKECQEETVSLVSTVESLVGEDKNRYIKDEKRRRRLCDVLHMTSDSDWEAITVYAERIVDDRAIDVYRYEIRKILDLPPATSWKDVVREISSVKMQIDLLLAGDQNKKPCVREADQDSSHFRELIASMLVSMRRTLRFVMMFENTPYLQIDHSEYAGMRTMLQVMEDAATRAGF